MRFYEVEPRLVGLLCLRCQYLYLITAFEHFGYWYEAVVYLAADTVIAQIRMQRICKIEHGGVLRQFFDVSLWRKYHYFFGIQIYFESVYKLYGVYIFRREQIFDRLEPLVKFRIVFYTVFIFPVSRQAAFGYLVHSLRAYLYFDP